MSIRVLPLFSLLILLTACESTWNWRQEEEPEVPVVAPMSEEEKALLAKADAARSLGQRNEAMRLYEEAAALSQGTTRAHLELAAHYREALRHDDALAILQQGYERNPASVELLKEYALQALRMGDDALAGKLAAQGLALSPEDVRLLNVQGLLLDRVAKHEAAQTVYMQALAVLSGKVDREYTVNNLGLSYVASGDYAKAIALLEPELDTAENKPALRQLLALAYGASGNRDRAYELGLMDMKLEQVRENLVYYEQLGAGQVNSRELFQPARN